MPDAIDATRLINAAWKLLEAMDGGQSMSLWERASPAALACAHAEALGESVDAQRRGMGGVRHRRWVSVQRRASDGRGDLPAGHYVNVVFDVAFGDGQSGQELITLRHDADGVWRLTGYALR